MRCDGVGPHADRLKHIQTGWVRCVAHRDWVGWCRGKRYLVRTVFSQIGTELCVVVYGD